jgi:hypothetical protein
MSDPYVDGDGFIDIEIVVLVLDKYVGAGGF